MSGSLPPYDDLRPGYEWRVYVDPEWRVLDDTPKRCRGWQWHRENGGYRPQAVAELNRGRVSHIGRTALRGNGKRPAWWAYCADHLYGRWVEDGHVVEWRVRRVTDPEGEWFVRRWVPT